MRRAQGLALVASILVVALVAGGSVWFYRSRHRVVPLLSEAVVLTPTGQRVGVTPGDPFVQLYPGTRVARSSLPEALKEARAQRQWLDEGSIPGAGDEYQNMTETALLDLHTLLNDNGALIAGWPGAWHYVWPRDSAFAAVALSGTGHTDDALRILGFLQRVQPSGGVFQARYFTDGSGPPDTRGEQSDGTGWALWAVQRTIAVGPADRRAKALAELQQLIDRSTAAIMRLTDRPGLRAAADLAGLRGDTAGQTLIQARATLLENSIRTQFGIDDYPRYLGGGEPDAAVAFLLPPFTTAADPLVLASWRRASALIRRSGAGLAPGAGWRNDGISWTPQTALFALTAAATGNRSIAKKRLDWLSAHRTIYGALPEKVLSNGVPAGPAPLTWTSALVVLAVNALPTDK